MLQTLVFRVAKWVTEELVDQVVWRNYLETKSLEEDLEKVLSVLRKIRRKQSQVSENLQSVDHTPVGLKRLRKDEAHEKVD